MIRFAINRANPISPHHRPTKRLVPIVKPEQDFSEKKKKIEGEGMKRKRREPSNFSPRQQRTHTHTYTIGTNDRARANEVEKRPGTCVSIRILYVLFFLFLASLTHSRFFFFLVIIDVTRAFTLSRHYISSSLPAGELSRDDDAITRERASS